jgi:predicted site-specific integrase-resolvase
MLTAREVAERIGAAYSSVRIWAKEGRFPGAQLERPPAGLPYWMIPESALEGYVMRGVGRPPKPKQEHKPRKRKGQ